MLNTVGKRLNYIYKTDTERHTRETGHSVSFEIMQSRLKDRSNSYTYENHVPNILFS